MGTLSFTHLLLLTVILLILFGPSKLPKLGESLGRAIRGFKDGLNEIDGQARDLGAKNDSQPNQQLHHDQQTRAAQQQQQQQHETSDINKKS